MKTPTAVPRLRRASLAGILVTLGIVYGDIGTSPLYVMNAIIADAGGMRQLTPDYIIGSISLIFWTLMIITTLKYVVIAMKADNNGEGGIFALYALVRRRAKWLIVPALIGGAAILADGSLTPAMTVTSAIEGLKGQHFGHFIFSSDQHVVVLITIVILVLLFMIQRFGTSTLGQAFGPIMLIWFLMLGLIGFFNLLPNLEVLKALSPVYAIKVLFAPTNKVGIFILGSIFLATTGAEALYSDMGHVGKYNIYLSWPFVYLCLMLSYFGQGAWLIRNHMSVAPATNPFFAVMPSFLKLVGVIVATLAAIIASQALITGAYTLVSEAMRLKILPRMVIKHPSMQFGQLYIATVNWILCAITLIIVVLFQTSAHMEAAYGLAITVTMLMTTLLLHEYLSTKFNRIFATGLMIFFGAIETVFFLASIVKFTHGGYVTVLITLLLVAVMYFWYFGNILRDRNEPERDRVSLLAYRNQLVALSHDESIPLYATNLVYMTKVRANHQIKRSMLYSILDKRPKRAQVYWFVTVNVTSEPYTRDYSVDMMGTRNIANVQIYLGFRREQRINAYLRQIVVDLMHQGKIDRQPQAYTTMPDRDVGDFSFVILQEWLSPAAEISNFDRFIINGRIRLQNYTASPIQWFGLTFSDVVLENVPLLLGKRSVLKLHEISEAERQKLDQNSDQ